jgi:hypothetical protein
VAAEPDGEGLCGERNARGVREGRANRRPFRRQRVFPRYSIHSGGESREPVTTAVYPIRRWARFWAYRSGRRERKSEKCLRSQVLDGCRRSSILRREGREFTV